MYYCYKNLFNLAWKREEIILGLGLGTTLFLAVKT